MSKIRVRLDPANPGHFFACCGLLELAAKAKPDARGFFELIEKRPRQGFFVLDGIAEEEIRDLLGRITRADYAAAKEDEAIKAILPIRVQLDGKVLELNWWLRPFQDRAIALKGWGGQVTSLKLFKDLPLLFQIPEDLQELLEIARPTSSRFGVDPRSSWNSIDLGYSPNEQGQEADSFPNVELLAAYGLQGFRPAIGRRRLTPYFLWTEPLHRATARTAAFFPWPGLKGWRMQFQIEGRGQSYKYFAFGKRFNADEELSSAKRNVKALKIENKEKED